MRGRDKFKKFEKTINILSSIILIFPEKIRLKMFYHFRKTQGNKGLVIRYILLKNLVEKCGRNVSIHPDVYIFNLKNLSIGDNVSIHPMCYLECGEGKIKIGNDVSIAHGVTILSVSHSYDKKDIPIKEQELITGQTIIEDNVWIGAKSTIVFGRTIKSGCIIGANSIVTKDTESNTIVAGNPAKMIKERI